MDLAAPVVSFLFLIDAYSTWLLDGMLPGHNFITDVDALAIQLGPVL
jgi:hypothetical protein